MITVVIVIMFIIVVIIGSIHICRGKIIINTVRVAPVIPPRLVQIEGERAGIHFMVEKRIDDWGRWLRIGNWQGKLVKGSPKIIALLLILLARTVTVFLNWKIAGKILDLSGQKTITLPSLSLGSYLPVCA